MIKKSWCNPLALLTLMVFTLFATFVQAGVVFTTLRYGSIDAQIVTGSLNGNTFNGTINWAGATNANTGNLTVTDIGSGVLRVDIGTTVLFFPQPYTPVNGNWSYNSKAILLNNSGAKGELDLLLPEGIQYKKLESDDFYRENIYGLDLVDLDQFGRVFVPVNLAGKLSRMRVENEPFNIQITGACTYDDTNGFVLTSGSLRHDFSDEFDLDIRPTNTGWLHFASLNNVPSVTHTGMQFEAEQKGASQDYTTAFPAEMILNDANWSLTYEDNAIEEAQLTTVSVIQNYRSEPCSAGPATRAFTVGPTTFDVGADWALMGKPNSALGPNLNLIFDAYEIGPTKRDGTVYVPGSKTAGEANLEDLLPSAYLLAGRINVVGDGDLVFATYPEQAYTEGLAQYAGWNLELEEMEGVPFSLQMACVNAPFSSSDSCKIYLRRGGVSGSLDASPSSVASLPPLQLYGQYDTVLTKFNISLLDNHQWQDSAIDGTLTLPFPSDVAFDFKSLELDSCGSPGAAKIKTFESILAYWNRSFKFRGLEFRDVLDEQGDPVLSSCGTNLRTLWTSSTNTVPEISKALLVDANFQGNGNIADIIITSEASNTLQGWNFTIREMYYSKWDNTQNINGKTVVIGDMKLPFWGATPVVAWFDAGITPQVFDGRSYAQSPVQDIDADRNSFPAGISTIAQYMNAANRRPLVKSSFANIIDLEYRVKYDNFAKKFATASGEENGRDLIVLSINSQVRGITKTDTEVLFAAEFGVPAINVSSLLENLTDPVLQQLMGPIKENMNVVNSALSGQLGQAIRGGMEDLTRPAVTQLVNNIRTAAANADGALSAAEQANINNLINAQLGTLEGVLQGQLAQGTGPIIGKIDEIVSGLENISEKIESLDPATVEQILVALIELADADPSGVQQVFGDVEAARSYIVDELINGQLKPQLLMLRTQLDNLGTIPELDALINGSDFDNAMKACVMKCWR